MLSFDLFKEIHLRSYAEPYYLLKTKKLTCEQHAGLNCETLTFDTLRKLLRVLFQGENHG